ncbi:MAG: coproporphyrinogen III oxidase [Draconibacterium sp.]|nr:MAG: coproporphyrinogen III oxidase [Draconibacterium sp.]
MAGIYIHIPFCKQKCHYCDFYKSTNIKLKNLFIQALKKELEQRVDYLEEATIKTIYFGGGTPSILSISEVQEILIHIANLFTIDSQAEITFEANPDDLTKTYLTELKKLGINRLSMGIQSFDDDILKLLNRRHNANQAIEALKNVYKAGITNISADLIYGIPTTSQQHLKSYLKKIAQLPVNHLSAYHLTYHENTVFYNWLKKGTLHELSEEESVHQYKILIEEVEKTGFEQYEISNFAKNEQYSQHNVGYWRGTSYLGVGASAHSYDGHSRQWNIANVKEYIKQVENKEVYFERETLSKSNRFNEYIITNIRTKWGISLRYIQQEFGNNTLKSIEKYLKNLSTHQLGTMKKDNFILTQKGLFISDKIMANLMIDE